MSKYSKDEIEIKENWARYWREKQHDVEEWDALSESILIALKHILPDVAGKSVLEAGCGTGRISRELAADGAHVVCLDIAEEALAICRKTLSDYPDARFVHGSILSMPREEQVDVIWNAGVLEHFTPEEQSKIIEQFIESLKPQGMIIILTPYARSFLYRIGKFILERTGGWPYGRETPVQTLQDVIPRNVKVEEYTISFLPLILDAYKFLPFLKKPLKGLNHWISRPERVSRLYRADRRLSRIFGGYLLVSILCPDSNTPA
jgi:2-polyprenyl-3-methyl-5-hydroxy-6-metoxy-1,4-benzoquinol methylase